MWEPEGYVFSDEIGRPLGLTSLTRIFSQLVEASKVKKISLHDLRHTFASLALMRNANISVVSAMLGHASSTITYDIYRHIMPGETGKVANLFQEMLNSLNEEPAAYLVEF